MRMLNHVGKAIAVLTVLDCFGTRLLLIPDLIGVSFLTLAHDACTNCIEGSAEVRHVVIRKPDSSHSESVNRSKKKSYIPFRDKGLNYVICRITSGVLVPGKDPVTFI